MTDEMVSLADRVRSLRKDRGLSQTALAKRIGMTPSQLCKIELGHNGLSGSSIARLANALEIPISALMGEKEARAKRRNVENALQYESSDFVQVLAGDLSERVISNVARIAQDYNSRLFKTKNVLKVMSQSSIPLVFPYGVNEEASELLARDMRFALGIGSAPVEKLETVLEFHGVHIVRHSFPRMFQSASFFNRKYCLLVIVLNELNTHERNDYRLAYELGAATAFAMSGFCTIRDEGMVHRFLRRFSAAFLMPEDTMRMDVAQTGITPNAWTMDLLVMMKARFSVSAEAYALRLESLGLIAPQLRMQLRDKLRAYYRHHPKAMEPQPKDHSLLAILTQVEKGCK